MLQQDPTISPIQQYEKVIHALAEMAYRIILTGVMYFQAMVITFVPYIGDILCFVVSCFLYGYVAFDYKWSLEQKSLHWRINYGEIHWLWLVGFGLPITAISFFGNFLMNAGLYAVTLPFMIILTIGKVEPKKTPSYQMNLASCCSRKNAQNGSTQTDILKLVARIFTAFISFIKSILDIPLFLARNYFGLPSIPGTTTKEKTRSKRESNNQWTVFTLPLYLTALTIELARYVVNRIKPM